MAEVKIRIESLYKIFGPRAGSVLADVRQGKYIEIDLTDGPGGDDSAGGAEARAGDRVREMCEKLLANTVIENYRVEIES